MNRRGVSLIVFHFILRIPTFILNHGKLTASIDAFHQRTGWKLHDREGYVSSQQPAHSAHLRCFPLFQSPSRSLGGYLQETGQRRDEHCRNLRCLEYARARARRVSVRGSQRPEPMVDSRREVQLLSDRASWTLHLRRVGVRRPSLLAAQGGRYQDPNQRSQVHGRSPHGTACYSLSWLPT